MPKVMLKSGVQIHYQQVGQGPDLVLLHGLTGNLAVWHFRVIPLLENRFRILTYDLRGHGYSDMPPTGYSPTTMAEDLVHLLDALGIEQAPVVGHSYGADIALYAALHNPAHVKRVVAIEAVLPAMMGFRALENSKGWGYWADLLEEYGHPVPPEHRYNCDYLIRQTLLLPKKWGPLNGLPRNPKRFLQLLDETTIVRDYENVGELTVSNIEKIRTPVTLIYVEESSFLSSHDCLSARLPEVDSIMLPKTKWGHFGPLEQPDLVAAHVEEIVNRDVSPEQVNGVAHSNGATRTNGATRVNGVEHANGVEHVNGVAAGSNLVRGR